jgi:uncharacterized protein YacL
MTSPNNSDWQRKLEDIEREVNRSVNNTSVHQTTPIASETKSELSERIKIWIQDLKNWFNVLPPYGKVIAGGVGAIVGLSILGAVLKVVSALVSIAVMSVVLYFAYKFFIASSNKS